MNVEEAAVLEIGVHRVGDATAHAEHRAEGIGPGTQMGNRAQEFEAVAFLLQRESIVSLTVDDDLCGLELPVLAFSRRGNHVPTDADTITGTEAI